MELAELVEEKNSLFIETSKSVLVEYNHDEWRMVRPETPRCLSPIRKASTHLWKVGEWAKGETVAGQ